MRTKKGMTLVEIVFVVVIVGLLVGLLAVIFVPQLQQRQKQGSSDDSGMTRLYIDNDIPLNVRVSISSPWSGQELGTVYHLEHIDSEPSEPIPYSTSKFGAPGYRATTKVKICKSDPNYSVSPGSAVMTAYGLHPVSKHTEHMIKTNMIALNVTMERGDEEVCVLSYPLDPNSSDFVGKSIVKCFASGGLLAEVEIEIRKDPNQTNQTGVWH